MGKLTSSLGPGWYELLREAAEKLPGVPVHQAYQKLGTLRITYALSLPIGQSAFVHDLCQKSATICEDCGAPGAWRDIRGLYRTTCESCAPAWERKMMPAKERRKLELAELTKRNASRKAARNGVGEIK